MENLLDKINKTVKKFRRADKTCTDIFLGNEEWEYLEALDWSTSYARPPADQDSTEWYKECRKNEQARRLQWKQDLKFGLVENFGIILAHRKDKKNWFKPLDLSCATNAQILRIYSKQNCA